MNNKVQVNQTVMRILYYKYKDYVIPGLIFSLTWVLFFLFVFPQIQNFFAEKDAVVANEQTLTTMTQNYNLVAQQDPAKLDSYLQVAKAALPTTKDFAGILTAISTAAGQSGVTLNDYTFQIGSLTGKISPKDQTVVKINLTVNGSIDEVKQFLIALSNQLPLSEVTSVSINGINSSIDASFFYNPLGNTTFDPAVPLLTLTQDQENILNSLKEHSTAVLAPIKRIFPTPSVIPSVTPTVIPTLVTPTTAVSTSSASQE